ncbi:MAG: hypothetical protein MRY83_16135 [Flavobacteriales bacterium]|nr:hypothetical protein [Flavobacteriales bacterium]
MKRIKSLIIFLLLSISTFAQQNAEVEMADGLRASGKIYVVVVVVLILFLGLLAYLIYVDRSVKKLEKRNQIK